MFLLIILGLAAAGVVGATANKRTSGSGGPIPDPRNPQWGWIRNAGMIIGGRTYRTIAADAGQNPGDTQQGIDLSFDMLQDMQMSNIGIRSSGGYYRQTRDDIFPGGKMSQDWGALDTQYSLDTQGPAFAGMRIFTQFTAPANTRTQLPPVGNLHVWEYTKVS